jgi:lipoate-protein ligase B
VEPLGVNGRLAVLDLGRRSYAEALELQRHLCRRRLDGAVGDDLLLLVEHDPVVTLGRGTRAESLPVPPAELPGRGIEVFEVERGGDVTFHEPGQLVGYPILDLQALRPDLHWYLRELEGALIDALAELGLAAERRAGLTGVWTGPRKIASIGIHVKRWITFHGFALNVTNALEGFGLIVPCGIPGVEITSVVRELERVGADPASAWARTRAAAVDALGRRFGRIPAPATLADILGEAAGNRNAATAVSAG